MTILGIHTPGDPYNVRAVLSEDYRVFLQNAPFIHRDFDRAAIEAVRAMAVTAEVMMKEVISQGKMTGPKQVSHLTIAILLARQRIGGKHGYRGLLPLHPLYRNREIHGNIHTRMLQRGHFFVGIWGHKKSKVSYAGRRAQPVELAALAELHENGATIHVGARSAHTPGSVSTAPPIVRFFKLLHKMSGGIVPRFRQGTVIRIPPRSFREPVIQALDNRGGFGRWERFELSVRNVFNRMVLRHPAMRMFR